MWLDAAEFEAEANRQCRLLVASGKSGHHKIVLLTTQIAAVNQMLEVSAGNFR